MKKKKRSQLFPTSSTLDVRRRDATRAFDERRHTTHAHAHTALPNPLLLTPPRLDPTPYPPTQYPTPEFLLGTAATTSAGLFPCRPPPARPNYTLAALLENIKNT